MLPKVMLENWEEFALQTMKETWDSNMAELKKLLQIPPTTCKPLGLLAPEDDKSDDDHRNATEQDTHTGPSSSRQAAGTNKVTITIPEGTSSGSQ